MSAPHGSRRAERDELDALVDAEVELVLRHRPRPAEEPETTEALFLERARAFLARHPEPGQLIEELKRRIAPVPQADTEAPSASEVPQAREEPT